VDQLLIALDVDTGERALQLAGDLRGVAGGMKVGSRLFTLEGPALVRRLTEQGHRVFLDLKFHDIPNTVAQAVESAVRTGAWMINVHASGGAPMMRAAAQAGRETAARLGKPAPLLIGVTVLTSMDQGTLAQVGIGRPVLDHVVALARLSREAGLAGVVASPQETRAIRGECGPEFVIVTPGIRSAFARAQNDDQARTMGPAEAVRAGASYIVVGRPIIAAPDPRAAAEGIARELAAVARRQLTLYSKPGCHLCDDMKAVIDAVGARVPFALEVIDITTDPELETRYGIEIPVLLVDGKKAAKYRVTVEELERRLRAG
jgi:orotidine-5'-phosphate decarboxylase